MLSLGNARGFRTTGKWILALEAGFGVASFYVGRGALPVHFARLDGSLVRHLLLTVSTLGSLLYAGVSILEDVTALANRALKWTSRHARDVIYAALVVIAVSLSADIYFVGTGAEYNLRAPPLGLFGPGSGTYAWQNVLEKAVTDNRGNAFLQRKPPGTIRIVLEGASTMWGAGLPHDDAPDATLRRLLAARYPDQRFEVLQLGLHGKTQQDELIESLVLVPRWSPDLVISLNGFNDVANHTSDQFESQPYWLGQVETLLKVSAPERILFETTQSGPLFWQRKLEAGNPPVPRLTESDLYTPPRFYFNLEATARNLRDAGIRYAFSVTPNVYELGQGERWKGRELRYRRRMASEIVSSFGHTSFDIMESVRGPSSALFTDDCHLTKAGVETMFSWIADRIPSWLSNARTPAIPVPSVLRAGQPVEYLDVLADSPLLRLANGELIQKTRYGPVIRNIGKAGLIHAGPTVDLDAGNYRAEWWGRVLAPGPVTADVSRASEEGTNEALAIKTFALKEEGQQRLAAVSFGIDRPRSKVELHFHSGAPETKLELWRVMLFRLTRAPNETPPPEWDD